MCVFISLDPNQSWTDLSWLWDNLCKATQYMPAAACCVCARHKINDENNWKCSHFDLIYLIKKQFDCNLTYRLHCSTYTKIQPITTHFHSFIPVFLVAVSVKLTDDSSSNRSHVQIEFNWIKHTQEQSRTKQCRER